MWGVPTAFFTVGEPILTGCRPSAGYYAYDNTKPPAQISFKYHDAASTTAIPLVATATSNVSEVPSFNITWAANPHGPLKWRPARVDVTSDDANQTVTFTYDEQGRIIRQVTKSRSRRVRPPISSLPLHKEEARHHAPAGGRRTTALGRTTRRAPLLPGASGVYEERYAYESAAHPDFITYHETHDPDFGVSGANYGWTIRASDGKVVGTVASDFEDATCPTTCGKGASCCREALRGGNSSGPSCFAVPSCGAMGNTTWQYDYTKDGRLQTLTEDLTKQDYNYTADGRLAGYHQGNITLQRTIYDKATGTQIEAQVFFVIYPLVAELWGYDPPAFATGTSL